MTITSPILMTITSPHPADHHISPFEGSPRAGAAEYVQRGDVYNYQIGKSTHRLIDSSPNLLIC